MILAISGGTGFVGQHLLRMAAEQGHKVRALTRAPRENAKGITWIEGSLDDRDSLTRLAEGADAVIHVAGRISGSVMCRKVLHAPEPSTRAAS